MSHTCTVCQESIPAGMAVLRSVDFVQVAYHRQCWELRQEVAAAAEVGPVVPVQGRRVLSLSERLVEAGVR